MNVDPSRSISSRPTGEVSKFPGEKVEEVDCHVEQYLETGGDPNATINGIPLAVRYALRGRWDTFEKVITHGNYDPEAEGKMPGHTPLTALASGTDLDEGRKIHLAKIVLAKVPPMNQKTFVNKAVLVYGGNKTAMEIAIDSVPEHNFFIDYLVTQGAKKNNSPPSARDTEDPDDPRVEMNPNW